MLAGSTLIVTNVDTEGLVTHKALTDVLYIKKALCKASSVQKVLVSSVYKILLFMSHAVY